MTGPAGVFAQQEPPAPRLVGGRNVNMAGGSQILDVNPQTYQVRGDVLGRAQNEPSCAISTRNPQHILCGANDYRMVDVPGVSTTQIIRDAWLGEFQSADGGDTWESTLTGGFVLDPAPHILKTMGFTAAADPVVRSGPGGLAFYAGIAFTKDKSRSALHVTTYADLNNRELDAMPFKRVRTVVADIAEGARFIDKPWIYVEADAGGRSCTIDATAIDPGAAALGETLVGKKLATWLAGKFPGWTGKQSARQRIPASIVHVVYTVFLDPNDQTAEIRYTRSDDCGQKFSKPVRLNDVNVNASGDDQHGNGAAIAKPFVTGAKRIVITWRRVKPVGSPATVPADAIMAVVSNNDGKTFTAPFVVELICPFDQGTSVNSFRTTAFPTMTADASGRMYVAWSDRRQPNGACPIHPVNQRPEGAARIRVATSVDGVTWSSSVAVPSNGQEHQIMPSLAFTAGRLFLAWVDFGEDVSQLWGQYVDEGQAYLARSFRHTGDIRASMALPGPAPAFDAASRISEYLRGTATINGERRSFQLQWNAVNRRWARKGTVPFYGDYIDIATRPYLPPDPLSRDRSWRPNNALTMQTPLGPVPVAPNLLIAWGDNRDMRNGAGVDDTTQPVPFATPSNVNLPANSAYVTAVYGQVEPRPVCTVGVDAYKTGTTNQNAYAARASIGFLAASPGGNKALGALQRTFVIFLRNDEIVAKTFQLAATPPAGATASFDQFITTKTVIDAIAPARSSIARTVYVAAVPGSTLDALASVKVDVIEMAAGAPVQATSVILNADASAPEIESPEIESREIFAPEIESPEIESRTVSAPEIESPEIESPEIESPEIESAIWRALGLQWPEIESPEIESPEIESPEIESPEIESPEIESLAITDARFAVTNTGNTIGQYNAKAFVNGLPSNATYQIIVRRRYEVPAVNANCEPTTIPISKVIVNIPNVQLGAPEIESPEIESSAPGTASFYIAPGETVEVVVRARHDVNVPVDTETFDLAAQPEAVDSPDAEAGFTKPETVTTYLTVRTTTLGPGTTGAAYSAQLEASGNTGAVTWSAPNPGALPPGLSLGAAGQIVGTPTQAGSFTFDVVATDAALKSASAMLTIIVTTAGTATLAFVAEPSDAIVNAAIAPPVSVRAFSPAGTPVAGVAVTLARQDAGPLDGGATGLTVVTNATGVAVFDTLSVPAEATGIRLVSAAAGYTGSTSGAFNVGVGAPPPPPPMTAYTTLANFVLATGAVNVTGPLPSLGSVNLGANVGAVSFTPAPGGDTLDIGGAIDWHGLLPGNDIALGFERLRVTFASPQTAIGFYMIEPDATVQPWGGTPVDSTFEITLYNGNTVIASTTFSPPNDRVVFYGFRSVVPFTSAQIVDLSGNDDDEYFGEFYAGNGTQGAAFVVTNTGDSGPGSLRQALLDAEAAPGANSIVFNIAGPGPHEIGVLSHLPPVSNGAVSIDASTQPGYDGHPIVELDTALGQFNGPALMPGADGSVVRGLAINDAARAIVLAGNNNTVIGNWLGVARFGLPQRQGSAIGVETTGDGNRIGGPLALERNLISANVRGIRVAGTSNTIEGNSIGTSSAGDGQLYNIIGVGLEDATSTLVTGNLISGNTTNVRIDNGSLNMLRGNTIGLDGTGSYSLADGVPGVRRGVVVSATTASVVNTIGADAPGEVGNVISGNPDGNVVLSGAGVQTTQIRGNIIGLDATGTALPAMASPQQFGINIIGATGTRIGASLKAPWALNVIGGNQKGIQLISGASGTTIYNNYIGTSITGLTAVANGVGVTMENVSGNTVGGDAGEGNVIAGNLSGIEILASDQTTGTTIANNLIGVAADGVTPLGNGGGVTVLAFPGGTVSGTLIEQNTIANNGGRGITIQGDGAVANRIRRNRLFDNGSIGIDLGGDGVTANDAGDSDAGPNLRQNTPVITSATPAGDIQGTLDSTPSSAFTIELFATATCDPSGFGEGARFLGSVSVSTGSNGQAVFSTTAALTAGEAVTATATDASGNTSEFSACATVAPPLPPADLAPASGPAQMAAVSLPDRSQAVAVNPVTGVAYVVAHSYGGPDPRVLAIDGESNAVVATYENLRPNPAGMAVNTATNKIYVASDAFNPYISVIDVNSGTVGAILTGHGIATRGVAVDPIRNRVFVTLNGGGVTVIDGATATPVMTTTDGTVGSSSGIKVNPATNKVYIAGHTFITVHDGDTMTELKRIPLADFPTGVAIDIARNRIYTAGWSGTTMVHVIDGNTDTVVASANVPSSGGIALDEEHNLLYVSHSFSGTVNVLDAATLASVTSFGTGGSPIALAVHPTTGRVYAGTSTTTMPVVLPARAAFYPTPEPGSTTRVRGLRVRNIGTQASGASDVRLYLTPPGDPSTHLAHLATVPIAGVTAADPVVVEPTVVLSDSIGPGSYVLKAVVDEAGTVPESDESNNVLLATVEVRPPTTVANTNDSGPGSLRAAIDAANASPDLTRITFRLPGGATTIQPLSPLPAITTPVVVDGTTQPGYLGTPIVELDGALAGADANGLTLQGGSSVVRGLIVGRFDATGIYVQGSNNVVAGNFIGTDVTGSAARPNGDNGVVVTMGLDNLIGGSGTLDRNVISSNPLGVLVSAVGTQITGNYIGLNAAGNGTVGAATGVGIHLAAGNGTRVTSNVIAGTATGVFAATAGSTADRIRANSFGLDAAGTTMLPSGVNSIAIVVDSSDVEVGGADPAFGNVIAGYDTGVYARWGTGILIASNRIGSDRNSVGLPGPTGNEWGIGLSNSGNIVTNNFITTRGQAGIALTSGPGLLASNNLVQGNFIANNPGRGIMITRNADNPSIFGVNNNLGSNRFWGNGALAIDLEVDGPTANDAGDTDDGPNRLQNFPIINGPTMAGSSTVTGSLESTPGAAFVVRVYHSMAPDCGVSGRGQGGFSIGSANVVTDGSGNAPFSIDTGSPLAGGTNITATATDEAGNTSEFSPCHRVPATLVVTNTGDTGAGSLRQAMLDANVQAGPDTISFAIPGAGPHTITPATELPAVTETLVIDGTTQPGYAGAPIVEIDGTAVVAGAGMGEITNGLILRSNSNVIRGLVINRFHDGIWIDGANLNTIAGNYIGTDVTGTAARPNVYIGVRVTGDDNLIGGATAADRNVISGNGSEGIRFETRGLENWVLGNYIGTDATGTSAVPNDDYGIVFRSSAPGLLFDNFVGSVTGQRNVISGNTGVGVAVLDATTGATYISNNRIGTSADGGAAVPNGVGVAIADASGSSVDNNLISGNAVTGVLVSSSVIGMSGVNVYGNYIGLAADLATPLGNGTNGMKAFASTGATITGVTVTSNTMTASGGAAVVVEGASASGVAILANSIYGNGGPGIDLGNDGETVNDANDADTGANTLQNHPAVMTASDAGDTVTIELHSTPGTMFSIEVFANPAGCGGSRQGKARVGGTTVTTNGSGNAEVTFTTDLPIAAGQELSALASGPGGNTSEFAPCVPVGP